MRISDWSSDVCSSDLSEVGYAAAQAGGQSKPARRPPGGRSVLADSSAQRDPGAGRGAVAGACPAGKHCHARRSLSGESKDDEMAYVIVGTCINDAACVDVCPVRSEEHTSELQSLMR